MNKISLFFLTAYLAFLPFILPHTALGHEDNGAYNRIQDSRIPHHPRAKVGGPAPDFSLEGVVSTEQDKEFATVGLNDYRGKWLVLFFYPADFTFVCPTEIRGFNSALDSFAKLEAAVIGISTDSKYSHLAWIQRGDLGELHYPLLSDFTKETARNYGVLDEETGVALRGLFIIDPKGIIQYEVVQNLNVGRSVDEALRVLGGLQTGGLCPLNWQPGEKTLEE